MVLYQNQAISASQYSMIELLRLYVPAIQNRAYPTDIREDAKMPRITVDELTPTEKRVGIGERYGTGMGLFYMCTFRVNIWDKEPSQIKAVADQVMYAIWKHRGYIPLAPNNSYGQFLLLEVAGGTGTTFNAGRGDVSADYQCHWTLVVNGSRDMVKMEVD